MAYTVPDWVAKPLNELNDEQWEALCDRCGKCCMAKLQDQDTLKIYYTNVACELFDSSACCCQDYTNRNKRVSDCISLSLERPHEFEWLPDTCAYRLRLNMRPLPKWHPLMTGDPDSTHLANISVKNKTINAQDVERLEHHLVDW